MVLLSQLPNLNLKTLPKKLQGSLPLDIALPSLHQLLVPGMIETQDFPKVCFISIFIILA